MVPFTLVLIIFGIFANAFKNEEALINKHLETGITTKDIQNKLQNCQIENHEIIKSMQKELAQLRLEVHKKENKLDELQKDIARIKVENCKDNKDIAENVEELKKEMKNRRIEISILQDHDHEKDVKIRNIEHNQNNHEQDIKDNKDIAEDVEELKREMENRQTEIGILQDHDYEKDVKISNIEHNQNDLSINITNVKNDLSDQITNMVIAPIGTIQGWSPVPQIGTANPVSIPKCWVPCDDSLIKEGIWIGQHTPDLNKANRYGVRNLEMAICFSLFGRLNDFIGQKCLKLKLRSAFVPT